MTTLTTILQRSCRGLACGLLLLACSREPYPIDGPVNGQWPDAELDLEAELANPGEEMHEPPYDPRPVSSAYCTEEEVAAHIKSNTHADGRINDEGLLCRKRSTAPVVPAAAPTTAPAAQH